MGNAQSKLTQNLCLNLASFASGREKTVSWTVSKLVENCRVNFFISFVTVTNKRGKYFVIYSFIISTHYVCLRRHYYYKYRLRIEFTDTNEWIRAFIFGYESKRLYLATFTCVLCHFSHHVENIPSSSTRGMLWNGNGMLVMKLLCLIMCPINRILLVFISNIFPSSTCF